MTVRSWHGRATAPADCLTCGERSPGDEPAASRAWGRRHAARNAGHTVHVVLERTLVYQSERAS